MCTLSNSIQAFIVFGLGALALGVVALGFALDKLGHIEKAIRGLPRAPKAEEKQ